MMKKLVKILILTITIIAIFVNAFVFNVSAAAHVTVGGGEYTVGQKVNISVKISNDTPIMAAQVNVSYNPAVLTLNDVLGADHTKGSGSINIVDENFSTATKDITTGSYTLSFTAAAAGSTAITASISIADKNLSKSTTSASSTVSVIVPKPSSNANLSSIKLSDGALSPTFNANTTSYSTTVKYSVEKVTISASVADGGATVTGAGTINLNVGDNSRVILVTAADGSKKSYTINIKRMTEQETADAEQAERDANPLLVVINNADYTIVNDFTNIAIPTGFTQGTATRKEAEITVLNDEHGEYTLYWLVDASGENGAFYTRDENDSFTRVNCIRANGKLYIIEQPDAQIIPPAYVAADRTIDGEKVSAYAYLDDSLKDFYVVKCYVEGSRAYYRFDTVEGTMQRAAEFDLAVKQAMANADEDEKNTGKFAWFTNMNKTGKTVFITVVLVAVLLVAVAILVIIKISSKEDDFEDEFIPIPNNDFILNDFADDEQQDTDAQPEELHQEQNDITESQE